MNGWPSAGRERLVIGHESLDALHKNDDDVKVVVDLNP